MIIAATSIFRLGWTITKEIDRNGLNIYSDKPDKRNYNWLPCSSSDF